MITPAQESLAALDDPRAWICGPPAYPWRAFGETFTAQAAATPEAIALRYRGQSMTYADLAIRSARVAAGLKALGLGRNALVGVHYERSFELVVATLGVLRAGAAWLPLDPAYPAARRAFMVADSSLSLVLGVSPEDANLAAATRFLPVDELANVAPTGADIHEPVQPEDLAYVIYTSGSTGQPKGVQLTQRGLANLFAAQGDDYDVQSGDRVLQFAPWSFDAAVFELVLPLGRGATLVLATREDLLPGPALAALMREERISHVTLPPSALAALPEVDLPALRVLACAGESLAGALVERWGAGRRFFNAYGPTETTVWATLGHCTPGQARAPIGRPVRGLRVAVVDEALRPIAAGSPGELLIGGAGVARGYLDRAALNAERFLPDPLDARGGALVYRTGDRVRLAADGQLEFLGRLDRQVKVRGFRIEPGEIEATLATDPAVRDALVVARGAQASGSEQLIAYVVASEGADPRALRQLVRGRLPEHMTPAVVVVLAAFPLTPSGKVDLEQLPGPPGTAVEGGGAAPTGPVEGLLSSLFGTLLGRAQVGRDDDFFALGGHSLLVGQLLARVREELGVELPLRTVYEQPTPAALAEAVLAARGMPVLPELSCARRPDEPPATYAQEQVYYLAQFAPGNLAYNAQATVRLRGPLNVDAVRQTLTEIVRRHEVYRTRFVDRDGVLVQQVQPAMPIEVPLTDLEAWPANERDARAETLVREEIARPFQLEQVPLARWRLLRLSATEHLLVQVEHHFVHDGWSFAVLMREFTLLYEAFASGLTSPLPTPPMQLADFALWQRSLEGAVFEHGLAYWRARLAGHPGVLELPTDRPRPALPSFRGQALRLRVEPELVPCLRALARRCGVTLFTVMLTAFGVLLRRWSGQDDLLIGSGVANRRLRPMEDMIGMVVNMLVLRLELAGEATCAEALARTQATLLDAVAHQDLPFEKLVEALAPERDLSRNPLFQAMFSFHDSPVPDLEFAGLRGEVLERHNGSAKADLNVVVIPRGAQRVGRARRDDDDRIDIIWEFSTDLFEAATMQRMAAQFFELLRAMSRDESTPLAALPLLPESERARLALFEHGDSMTSSAHLVHERVAAQAARQPDAPAVVWPGGRLSWAELEAWALALAANLQALGVAPGARVAVCLERGPELVVAQYATLKIGAAVVAVDPTYPRERIALMLRDAHVAATCVSPVGFACLPPDAQHVLVIARPSEATAPGRTPTYVPVTSSEAAFVLYTSGSTGQPKGTLLEHGGFANACAWMARSAALAPGDAGCLAASPGFDACAWELWGTLAAGATLHVAPDDVRASASELARFLVDAGVHAAFATTALGEALLDESWPADTRLRCLFTGGEQLRRRPRAGLPFRLWNIYGPTETTVLASADIVEAATEQAQLPSIGRPIDGVHVCVLDPLGARVPIGVPGELLIGGMGVARGYLGRPELEQERFVVGTDLTGQPRRFYRTGDRVRWLDDGRLEFLGRFDEQLKLRGHRIEPGEIEACLNAHPGVRASAVLLRADPDCPRQLVAYVVPTQAELAPLVLREHLARALPAYMLPAAYVSLTTLPVGPHGKLLRGALPAPERRHLAGDNPVLAPRTALESTLAGYVAELLGAASVGIEDDFFELGGHSLLATRLVSRVKREFQIELPLRVFLERPRVAALAEAVERARAQAPEAASVGTFADDADRLRARLAHMSDEEVDALLARELQRQEVAS